MSALRVVAALVFSLLPFVTDAAAQETPRMGGVLKVASIGEPPTLDMPMSTAVITYEIMRIQTLFYEDVGRVKLGDYFTLDVARRDLRGDFRTAPRLHFWNSWLAK